jgi:hypothetical protein
MDQAGPRRDYPPVKVLPAGGAGKPKPNAARRPAETVADE